MWRAMATKRATGVCRAGTKRRATGVAGDGDQACDRCVSSGDDEAARGPGRGESIFGPGILNYLPDRCWTAMIPVRVYNRLPRVGLRGHLASARLLCRLEHVCHVYFRC